MANGKIQITAKQLLSQEEVQKKFKELLGKKAQGFITSVIQCISENSNLQMADPTSVLQAAFVAATLDLPINANLGFAYIVPYQKSYKEGDVWKKKQVAQFQMGYKGYIQLSQRSGVFQTIGASHIIDGQLIEKNPLIGYKFDFTKGEPVSKIIGYASYFRLINGFEKVLYMSNEQLTAHGVKYSKAYNTDKSLWKTDFDAMATKTVIKLLLSRYAPMSIEMQRAVITDQALINDSDTLDVEYVDNEEPPWEVNKETERIGLLFSDAQTLEDLQNILADLDESSINDDVNQLYAARKKELTPKK